MAGERDESKITRNLKAVADALDIIGDHDTVMKPFLKKGGNENSDRKSFALGDPKGEKASTWKPTGGAWNKNKKDIVQ